MERLAAEGLELEAILVTHKHGDHVGGVAALKERWPGAQVYGPVHEPISGLDRRLGEGDSVVLEPLDATFRVMEVPGHTEGHLAYSGEGLLFCGDTLFAGGCGRVFSGTYEQLSDSLQRIASLPSETLVYCAHEYTLANLGFARWVEPDNQALLAREKMEQEKRRRGEPTLPSTLALERAPRGVQDATAMEGSRLRLKFSCGVSKGLMASSCSWMCRAIFSTVDSVSIR